MDLFAVAIAYLCAQDQPSGYRKIVMFVIMYALAIVGEVCALYLLKYFGFWATTWR